MKFIKNNLRVVIAIFVALILIIIGVVLLVLNKNEQNPNNNIEKPNKEEQIASITGMTGDDAVDIVRANFYSDNYKFNVVVTGDSLYKVIVTNTVNESETIYYVDPTNGQAYIDIDTN